MEREFINSIREKTILKTESNFYKLMVENIGDEITVSDERGNYLFVNAKAVERIGMPVYEIVGKNARELEQKGYLSRSVILEAIEKRCSVNILQKLKNGKTVIATAVPIFDVDGEDIAIVIASSKDVDEVNHLLATIENQEAELSLKTVELEKLRDDRFAQRGFLCADPKMREVQDTVMRIAPLDVTVLIEGETGTGKEVVANALHHFSKRSGKPFVKINCGIIPENLIETELFGYEQGAFTGADRSGRKGLAEIADGGTLFLDEIGEMPYNMQVKLLDFMQDGSYKRVGGTKRNKADVRVIAATNRNLLAMCDKELFRKDLYYRLNTIPLNVPPLRERPDDIRMLARSFVSDYNGKYNSHKTLDSQGYLMLEHHDWPGNVRELMHVIERAFIVTDGTVIDAETVSRVMSEGRDTGKRAASVICSGIMPLKEAKREVERQLVSKAMSIYRNTYRASEALSIDQSTVVKLLKRLGG
ncbi:MAG: sigma 54-interacting transcriptional regulator [Clostridiales Family XIII bacterium]|jgi:PAS domain S-box-containing protein|nr:sigma 54-interacting transcriptional regulator [Clostridiales Family XIII bacterium]